MGKQVSKAGNATKKKTKNKIVRNVVFHIHASFNNTIVTVTDTHGNVLCWASAGQEFRGSRKSVPFAAQVAAGNAAKEAKARFGVEEATVEVKGPGSGREGVRPIHTEGINLKAIIDRTPQPHNGVTPPKKRRV